MKSRRFTWLFLLPISSLALHLCFCALVVSGQCLRDQHSLLLHLKNSLVFNDRWSTKLVQWHKHTDCCSWEGVTCSEGRVIGLDLSLKSISGGLDNSSSLFCLHHLQNLSLAFNNFSYARIPPGFGKLTNLRHLKLSYASFAGQIPTDISHLRRLVILDLSSYYSTGIPPLKLENPNLEMLVQNFTELIELHLDGVQISAPGSEWCEALSSSLPNLRVMSFSNCNLSGLLCPSILKLPTLEILDLSYNNRLRGSLPDFPQNGNLRALELSYTNFSGTLPHTIGNLTMLSRMDVSWCNFSGSIPTTMANLTHLLYLDMSFNNLNGPIPSFSKAKNLSEINLFHNDLTGQITSTHWQELKNLVNLDLSHNSLNGSIPVSLFSHLSLNDLQLSNNQFSGQLNQFSNISSNVLERLDLSSNNLEGAIPVSIFNLRGLEILYLSSNNLSGSVHLNMIEHLTNLYGLDLSYNSLSFEYDRTDPPSPNFTKISFLNLASNKLKTFPEFLKNQSKLSLLDLSRNEIGGEIPIWMCELPSLLWLNLSFNNLVSVEGSSLNVSSLVFLDIRSNRLQGQLPILPPSATYLDFSRNNFSSIIRSDIGGRNFLSHAYFFSLSRNKFEGSMPLSICNATNLQVLDLSYNSFSGMIPECLVGMSTTLWVLNLGINKFNGTVPDTFPNNCGLQSLDLNGNRLVGQVPKSLENCTRLELFNIGNNDIQDIFPCHLKNASVLRVLVLHYNKFSGSIGCEGYNATWPLLQILDVASNNFTGNVPIKRFSTWKAMSESEDEKESELNHYAFGVQRVRDFDYRDKVTVTIKGSRLELVKILIPFTSIDFSCNNLEGPIPEAFGRLSSLYLLNLSHNAFSGQIPKALANLTQLESLDLSSNKLTGKIPIQLAESLLFLAVLNLSFNQLVGEIPRIKQFATFSEGSYEGNNGLCGFPLKKDCNAGGKPPSAAPNLISKKSLELNFVSVEIGFIFGFGIVIMPPMFWKRWRFWYFKQVDEILYKIFPKLYMIRKAYPGRNGRPRRQ